MPGWTCDGTGYQVLSEVKNTEECRAMNMKVLDHLIADSILEPSIAPSMENGSFSKIVKESSFEPDLKTKLLKLGCKDFGKFVCEAFDLISAYEAPQARVILPSAAEGIKLVEGELRVEAAA
jgi:hypothetical protein